VSLPHASERDVKECYVISKDRMSSACNHKEAGTAKFVMTDSDSGPVLESLETFQQMSGTGQTKHKQKCECQYNQKLKK